jgi:hypothetical protein
MAAICFARDANSKMNIVAHTSHGSSHGTTPMARRFILMADSALSSTEFAGHVRTYRRFVRGVGLSAASTIAILLLLYYFLG